MIPPDRILHHRYSLHMANSTVSLSGAAPYEVDNCRGVLRVFSDGSISRSDGPIVAAPFADDGSVSWKDVLYDRHHDLHLRLYKPNTLPSSTAKLPVIIYIHGGGFCIGSRTWPNVHNYCHRLCSETPAVVVAPDYRLAPENRIPAAIEDCVNALKWLQEQVERADLAEEWLAEAADFSKVFVVGDSAGGNIAHHLAVRLGGGEAAVRIRGYILLAPFFGGSVRTKSEAEGPNDAFLNLEMIDRFWRLSVPEGDNTDHPMVNPFGLRSPTSEPMYPGPFLVAVGSRDLLRDRALRYTNKLKGLGKSVEYLVFNGEEHGFFTFHPDSPAANKLMDQLKSFISKNSG